MAITDILRPYALKWLYNRSPASEGTLEEYISIVKNSNNMPYFAPLSIGSTDGLCDTDSDALFTQLPEYKKLLKKFPIPEADSEPTDFGKARAVIDWISKNTYYNGMQKKWMPDDTLWLLNWSAGQGFEHAINCRHKAIIYTDLLLARGMKAYPILLNSGEAERGSCHFVTHVYCREHGWIVMDPSFGSWFTDSSGHIMNVYELRDTFLSGEKPAVHNYSFNGTGECMDVYLNEFIEVTLTNISTWTTNALVRGIKDRSEVEFKAKVPKN